jgi:hypothetical protein
MKSDPSTSIESAKGGVYRSHARVPQDVLDAAATPGMRLAVAALQGARDKHAFLDKIADALHFPDYFGRNWDAFYDCLTTLQPGDAAGWLLLLREASGFARADPEEFAAAVDVLRDAVDFWHSKGRKLVAIVELESPVLAPELAEFTPPAA